MKLQGREKAEVEIPFSLFSQVLLFVSPVLMDVGYKAEEELAVLSTECFLFQTDKVTEIA